MGLAVVSLIVLAILGALAGLVLSRVLGAAGSRNEKRPGGSGEHRSEQELREEQQRHQGGAPSGGDPQQPPPQS